MKEPMETLSPYITLSDEAQTALHEGRAVVALEIDGYRAWLAVSGEY